MEADKADDQDRAAFLRERAQGYLICCARSYLAGRRLPKPTKLKAGTKSKAAADGRPSELPKAEQLSLLKTLLSR